MIFFIFCCQLQTLLPIATVIATISPFLSHFHNFLLEKEIVLEMVRAVANTNRDFRQGMLELEKLKQPDYQQNFLYHENSLDIEGRYVFVLTKE